MRLSCIILALALATGSEGVVLRGSAESLEVSFSGDWAALAEAESEDRSFLLSQLDQTESELVKLQQAATPQFAGLQVSATPEVKKVAAKAPETKKVAAKAPETKKVAVPAPVAKAAVAKTAAKKEESPQDMLKSLGMPKMPSLKGVMGNAALAPMLGMLKGLYQDSKDRISQQNTREEKSKKWFAEKEGEHKAKLATIEGRFKNNTLSEEFRTNETRDETRYFNYWSRCRERQHRQFHTNLKIQHAMMSKVKKMVDMYEKALSVKPADQAEAKKKLGQMTGMPEIVFLQNTVKSFCKDSLEQVQQARAELQQDSRDGLTY